MLVKFSLPLTCPPKQAWKLLSDLGAIQDWAPDVESATADKLAVGAVRTIRLKEPLFGKDEFVERIVDVGDDEFTYEIDGGVGPFTSVITTWRIGAHPARVIVGTTVEVPWFLGAALPVIRRRWTNAMRDLAQSFATHCS